MKLFTASILGASALGLAAMAGACTSSTPQTAAAASPATPATSIAGSCIDPRNIASQTIVSDKEIQFKLRNGETWVNKMKSACYNLKFEDGFTWDVVGTLVCSNQQSIKVIRSGTPCLLGEFSKKT